MTGGLAMADGLAMTGGLAMMGCLAMADGLAMMGCLAMTGGLAMMSGLADGRPRNDGRPAMTSGLARSDWRQNRLRSRLNSEQNVEHFASLSAGCASEGTMNSPDSYRDTIVDYIK